MSTDFLSGEWVHTTLVIAGFVAIVLAPVLVAVLFGQRTSRKRRDSSAGRPAFVVRDPMPPKVTHHLRPRPRRHKPRH